MIVSAILLLLSVAAFSADDDHKQIRIDADAVYRFVVSLAELKENNQNKHLDSGEIKLVAAVFRNAKLEKKLVPSDTARMEYISRYELSQDYKGGTPKSGQSEFFVVTIDGRTVYWRGGLFTLDPGQAQQLLKIFPSTVNPQTKSERPEFDGNPK